LAWGIDHPSDAERVIRDSQMDLVMVGRAHLTNPHWPFAASRTLGAERPSRVLPAPYAHWLERYAGHNGTIDRKHQRLHRKTSNPSAHAVKSEREHL
jgi:tRNA-dihydrouridine synthase